MGLSSDPGPSGTPGSGSALQNAQTFTLKADGSVALCFGTGSLSIGYKGPGNLAESIFVNVWQWVTFDSGPGLWIMICPQLQIYNSTLVRIAGHYIANQTPTDSYYFVQVMSSVVADGTHTIMLGPTL